MIALPLLLAAAAAVKVEESSRCPDRYSARRRKTKKNRSSVYYTQYMSFTEKQKENRISLVPAPI